MKRQEYDGTLAYTSYLSVTKTKADGDRDEAAAAAASDDAASKADEAAADSNSPAARDGSEEASDDADGAELQLVAAVCASAARAGVATLSSMQCQIGQRCQWAYKVR